MNLADRLRSVIRPQGEPEASPLRLHDESEHVGRRGAPSGAPDPAELLDGEWRERDGHRFLVVDRRYTPGHRHGHSAVVDSAPEDDGCWPSLSILEPTLTSGRLMFLDLETTGLAGGAGTH